MSQARAVALAGLALMLGACGTSRPPRSINGHWFASVNNPDQSQAHPFSVTLSQGSGIAVNVTNFIFVSSPSCFSTPSSEVATFTSTGTSNGIALGMFTMTISTVFPTLNNVLTLQGARNTDGTISGTWTLTGQPGCAGNGNFTMNLPVTDPP
jgi:hypothetical protein